MTKLPEIAKFTEAYYVTWISSWKQALNHYLEFGEIFAHS